MGVHSLWDIVGPAARPVKLEALSRKRLAVDASIWIYQFMKAVRDKEGNSLGQTHIVGFFRRICKMLFFGILPLFVFDGGAPPLKRQVIRARKERRQGNQENAKSAAQKLLAMQIHRRMGNQVSVENRAGDIDTSKVLDKLPTAGETLYFDDLPMYHGDRTVAPSIKITSEQPKNFRRKDEYHLPDLKQFTVRKGDQRIMPEGELEDYGDESSWDVVDGVNIDSVDPSSAEFAELPMATQYMILSHLRLRSRLRLGYSKDQLENLFPNSKDFSKFQIQQVQKRNYYTQRLMNVSGMAEDTGNVTRRIAGDKDRQYMLVKNEGGWTLSLGSDHNEGPINLDEDGESERLVPKAEVKTEIVSEGSDDDDDLLEDVPLDVETGCDESYAATSKIEDTPDDENLNRAVIESIYDRFKHDYEDDAINTQKKDENIQREIEQLRETDLQKAIEESKKDYFQQKSKENKLAYNDTKNANNSEFEFGQSLLFGTADSENTYTQIGVTIDSGSPKTVDIEALSDISIDSNEHEEDKRARTVPSWFNDSSHLQNPHATIGFLTKNPATHKPDENEEAGIIPWNEAREYLEEKKKSQSGDGENFEILEHDSDVEIIDDQSEDDEADIIVDQPANGEAEPECDLRGIIETSKADGSFSVPEPQEQHKQNGKSVNRRKVDPRKVFVQRSKRPAGQARKRKLTESASVSNSYYARNEASFSHEPDRPNTHIREQEPIQSGAKTPQSIKEKPAVLDYDFDESEEEDLVKQLREEEQEHAQFTSSIQIDQIPVHSTVSNEQLLQEQLQKAKRDAEEVTQTMINDVQELLKRFGIPYITAPMEAEAQCAELYRLGLVDGIVTDDSDCFLFGGSRIYKNMFNQKQYVECYIADDIEHKVGLSQTKLIELALLLGSDYTEGVKGIGPVLAMEIIAEFGSLRAFKTWFDGSTKTLKRPDSTKNSKLEKTLRTRIKNGKLFLADTFPDSVVEDAYRHPEVDHDRSEFKWGVPSLDQIRSFLMYNVGWSQERVDEVMVPLIRNINKTRTEGKQTTVGEFFPQEYISYRKDIGMGKRMKAAADRIRGD